MKKSELRNIIKEEIENILKEKGYEQQLDHSLVRLNNIMKQTDSREKQNQLADLRTKRITDAEKLKSWIEILSKHGWNESEKIARKKLQNLN